MLRLQAGYNIHVLSLSVVTFFLHLIFLFINLLDVFQAVNTDDIMIVASFILIPSFGICNNDVDSCLKEFKPSLFSNLHGYCLIIFLFERKWFDVEPLIKIDMEVAFIP